MDAMSGQLSLSEVDLYVRGAQDLAFKRTYLSPQVLGRYDDKDERTISQAAIGGSVNGTFSDASAHLVGVGLNYMF